MQKLSLVIRVFLALFFIGFGFAKLFGWQVEVELFEKIGWGQWFRYFTGALQVLIGAGLLIPRFQFISAVLLTGLLIGATITQVSVLGNMMPFREVALIAASLFVVYYHRDQAVQWLGRSAGS